LSSLPDAVIFRESEPSEAEHVVPYQGAIGVDDTIGSEGCATSTPYLVASSIMANDMANNMANKSTAAAVKTQSEKVADSAKKLKESSVRIEDSADRRTELASNRTALAAERTYSAWIRTGLFSLASGLGAKGVLAGLMPAWLILADSSALVAFSIFCFGAAVWRFANSGATRPYPDVPRIDPRVLIVVSAFLSMVSLVALWGVWFA
jgi:putative membrane protein